jgi:hypothetical protein
MWVSDDPGCGSLIKQSPVRIDFAGGFADAATEFSLDQYTCLSSVSFNVYDKDGVLVSTEILPNTCFTFQSYQYPLTNGISAFEWTHPDSTRIEGNTAVDNVSLVPEPGGGQTLAPGLALLSLLHRRRRPRDKPRRLPQQPSQPQEQPAVDCTSSKCSGLEMGSDLVPQK